MRAEVNNRVMIGEAVQRASRNTLGGRLTAARLASGMPQWEVDRRAGMPPGSMSKIEKDETKPGWLRCRRICEVLEVGFMDIVKEEKLG